MARRNGGYGTYRVKYRNGTVLTLVDTARDIWEQAQFFVNAHGPIVGSPTLIAEGVAA